ncbi:MAG: hypothetical protein PW791_13510 [Neorhizobium sp.]|jgi:hypothetical protein|nr:hypothetical protein [Neorhizobium sp.]
MPVIARRFMIMTLIFINFAIAFSAIVTREDRVAMRGASDPGSTCTSLDLSVCARRA